MVQKDVEEVNAKTDKHGYIEKYDALAVREMHQTGIPASITLAQGILESRYGQSRLAKEANNHFGIKCNDNWDGPVVYKADDNPNDCFRKYRNPEQSYEDHSKYLTSSSRYDHLFELDITDYKRWARGLKKAGYATNPTYHRELIKIIERYELYRYDKLKNPEDYKEQKKPDQNRPKPKNQTNPLTTSNNTSKHPRIYEYNRVQTIITQQGDTPLKYAQKYNRRLGRLLKYNDLERTQVLKPGQKFYLQPKRNSNPVTDYHFVRPDETMRDISQQYAIKLRVLYKRNLIEPPDEPAEGEKLFLNHKRPNPVATRNPGESTANNTTPKQTKDHYYTVKEGDTLYSIAKKFNTTVEQLKTINDLSSENIEPGDELKISSENN
jgi:LysM repeat protein